MLDKQPPIIEGLALFVIAFFSLNCFCKIVFIHSHLSDEMIISRCDGVGLELGVIQNF